MMDLPSDSVLDLPLGEFMRPEIALTLGHVLQIHSVGALLNAWRNPRAQKSIEQMFDTPQQARHAVGVCATWLGAQTAAATPMPGWWRNDPRARPSA